MDSYLAELLAHLLFQCKPGTMVIAGTLASSGAVNPLPLANSLVKKPSSIF